MNIVHCLVFVTYALILYVFIAFIYLIGVHEQLTCFVCDGYEEIQPIYDYIVVGAGSAGSIMALRLSENRNKTVLLVEAGGEGNRFLDIPIIGPLLQRSNIDWQYESEPQQYAAFALKNNVAKMPSGRIVGGTGRLNNLIYLRGHSSTYNEWYKDQEHFHYESDILEYFKKSEDFQVNSNYHSQYHSKGGLLTVQHLGFYSCLTKQILLAAQTLGFPVHDLNADRKEGFMKVQVNANSGSRWTPYHHLATKTRSNLRILTLATARQVLFKHNYEASGIKVSHLHAERIIEARHGIILSAGTIGTPRILLSSGVGPREHLQQLDIPLIKDLPVGNNLQDHVTTGLDLIVLNQTVGIGVSRMLSPFAVFDYFYWSRGPWTSGGCEVVGVVRTGGGAQPGSAQPDLQLMVLPAGISCDGGYYLKDNFGIKDSVWLDYFQPLVGTPTVTILPVVLAPKSRGYVRLSGKSWDAKPLINPNYLQHPDDVRVLLQGIELIKRLISTRAMQELGARLNTNKFPGCETYDFDTADYWTCYVKQLTLTAYHYVGTCKMGARDDCVVDYGFKVRGMNKLYVVDASVMPQLPSGNTNAAVMMLAEKAAESILRSNPDVNMCRKKDVLLF